MAFYMHTLNNRPAWFDGRQVVYAMKFGKANKLCRDLKQIRSEQRASAKWRRSRGLKDHDKHGYFRYEP